VPFLTLLKAKSPLSLLVLKLTSDESAGLSNITVAKGMASCSVSCRVPLIVVLEGFWASKKLLANSKNNNGNTNLIRMI
jgi:hypothetical protein